MHKEESILKKIDQGILKSKSVLDKETLSSTKLFTSVLQKIDLEDQDLKINKETLEDLDFSNDTIVFTNKVKELKKQLKMIKKESKSKMYKKKKFITNISTDDTITRYCTSNE